MSASKAVEPGAQLGPYRVLAHLSSGGLTEVWLAEGATSDPARRVVLKTLRPEFAGDPLISKTFLAEAAIAAGLTHPNVVEVYDFGEREGVQLVASEFVFGRTLGQIARRARKLGRGVELWFPVRVALDVCSALTYIHGREPGARALVHRDVSSENIMLAFTGVVKLLDFGIVAANVSPSRGGLVGKRRYMAPERLSGRECGPTADVYALGVVLYEYVTGVPPFACEDETHGAQQVAGIPPLSPRSHNALVDEELSRIILRAIATSPEDRQQTAEELAQDLRRYLARAEPDGLYRPLDSYVSDLFMSEMSSGAEPLSRVLSERRFPSPPPTRAPGGPSKSLERASAHPLDEVPIEGFVPPTIPPVVGTATQPKNGVARGRIPSAGVASPEGPPVCSTPTPLPATTEARRPSDAAPSPVPARTASRPLPTLPSADTAASASPVTSSVTPRPRAAGTGASASPAPRLKPAEARQSSTPPRAGGGAPPVESPPRGRASPPHQVAAPTPPPGPSPGGAPRGGPAGSRLAEDGRASSVWGTGASSGSAEMPLPVGLRNDGLADSASAAPDYRGVEASASEALAEDDFWEDPDAAPTPPRTVAPETVWLAAPTPPCAPPVAVPPSQEGFAPLPEAPGAHTSSEGRGPSPIPSLPAPPSPPGPSGAFQALPAAPLPAPEEAFVEVSDAGPSAGRVPEHRGPAAPEATPSTGRVALPPPQDLGTGRLAELFDAPRPTRHKADLFTLRPTLSPEDLTDAGSKDIFATRGRSKTHLAFSSARARKDDPGPRLGSVFSTRPQQVEVPRGPALTPEALKAAEAFDRGLEHFGRKHHELALASWREAVTLDPSNRTYRANLRRLERLIGGSGT